MFDDHFEVFLADTPESKKIHYSIRYQVYCEEKRFENKDDFPHKLETDEYDEYSSHFIIRHIQTGQWIGAMRLIFRRNGHSFPMEKHCTFYEEPDRNLLKRSVEVSRLCVIKEIRRNAWTPKACNPAAGMPGKRRELRLELRKRIMFGLLRAASEYCYRNNIHTLYFLTTKSLSTIVRKGGINILRIGESCHHVGERYPFKTNVVETYHNHAVWKDDYKKSYRLFSQSAF